MVEKAQAKSAVERYFTIKRLRLVAAEDIPDEAIRTEIQDSAELVRHLIEGEASGSLIAKLPQIQEILADNRAV